MYHNTLLHSVEEMVIVALGPITVFILFLLTVIFCALTLKMLGSFPILGHKVILNLGAQSLFDPIFIAIVDAISKVSAKESALSTLLLACCRCYTGFSQH